MQTLKCHHTCLSRCCNALIGTASFTKTRYTYCIKYKPQPLTRTEERSEGTKAQRLVDAREGLLLLQRMPITC